MSPHRALILTGTLVAAFYSGACLPGADTIDHDDAASFLQTELTVAAGMQILEAVEASTVLDDADPHHKGNSDHDDHGVRPIVEGGDDHSAAVHGEADIHSEEAHEHPTDTSDAVASMLLAMTIFQISLFYMVNYPSRTVKGFTWSMLNATVSIFLAIFIWTVVSRTTIAHAAGGHGSPHGAGSAGHSASSHISHLQVVLEGHVHVDPKVLVVKFSALFMIFNAVLATMAHRGHVLLQGFATLGAHTLGFAAAEVSALFGATAPWNSSWLYSLGYACIVCCVLFVLNWTTTHLRKCCMSGNAQDSHAQEHFKHVCEHAEHEFAAFAVGLLVTLSIQFMITGELPDFHGNPYGKTMTETCFMFLGSLCLALILMLIIGCSDSLKNRFHTDGMHRAIHILEECVSFSFGWCILFSFRFLYWSGTHDHGLFNGDTMTARVIQALSLTFFTFFVILVLKGMGDRGYISSTSQRAMMSGFGLMLGLSWEGAFYKAMTDLTEEQSGGPMESVWVGNVLCLANCAVILPAWALYILPKSMENEKGHDDD